MPSAPMPDNEAERLTALNRYGLLDTPKEDAFERITMLAARLFDVPIAFISLLDANRQWFKSCFGLDAAQTDRDVTFCAYTILSDKPLIVKNAALDLRFADNPLVTGEPGIRFYAGAPLRTPDGYNVGTLYLVDTKPRSFSAKQAAILQDLAAFVVSQMELRHAMQLLENHTNERLHLAQKIKRLSLVATNTTNSVIITDANGCIEWINDGFTRITGYTLEEAHGKTPGSLLHGPETALDTVAYMREQRQAGKEFHAEIINYGKTGRKYWLEIEAQPIYEQNGQLTNFIAVQSEITERKQAELLIQHFAYHDSLTGLPNRLQFKDKLETAIAQARRQRRKLGVLFLDLDRFKIINDSLGHGMGDLLLKEVAKRVQRCLRKSDTVARLGGDEYVITLADARSASDVEAVAAKIVEAMRPAFHIQDREIFVTTSIGGSLYPLDGADAESLIKHADIAMYRAKNDGRNSYQMYTQTMNQRMTEKLALETGLHKAVANEEFCVYYQPQIALDSGRIIGMEALVRWQHPERGLIPPLNFIPLAEETGLISQIGFWVLRTACAQTRLWQQQGYGDLRVAVNLSLRQFQLPDMVARVAAILAETQLPPHCLELEITESIAMDDIESKVATLLELKALGVAVSLDDFGTGFSSLNYLTHLPIDTVKIDRSFLQLTTTDRRNAAIVAGIIRMAHDLDMQVIAEGVDKPEQVDFLQKQRCDTVQGYLYSKPIPAEQFVRLLSKEMALDCAA